MFKSIRIFTILLAKHLNPNNSRQTVFTISEFFPTESCWEAKKAADMRVETSLTDEQITHIIKKAYHLWPSDLPPEMDCCKPASSTTYSGCDLSNQKQMVCAQMLENMESSLRVCRAGTQGKTVTQLWHPLRYCSFLPQTHHGWALHCYGLLSLTILISYSLYQQLI